jgi:hypothetical protein
MVRKPPDWHQPSLFPTDPDTNTEPPNQSPPETEGDDHAVQDHRSRTPATTTAAWKETLGKKRPGSSQEQIASEALEIAVKELEDRLPPASRPSDNETLSLDAAMASIRKHTSRG